MSRGFIPLKRDIGFLSEIQPFVSKEAFEKDYQALITNEPYKMAARLVRYFSTDFKQFVDTVNNCLRTKCGVAINWLTEDQVLIVPHPKDATLLRVFINVKVSNTKLPMRYVSPICHQEVLKAFTTELRTDLASDATSKKWETTNRSWRRLKRYEDMPTIRALQRYTNIPKHIGEESLKSLAAAIDADRKPLEIIYAEKPEDFITMYASGPSSCMAKGGEGGNFGFMLKKQVHPTSFFAFHPHTKGAYIMRGGQVAARAILYEDHAKPGKWIYGRVYALDAQVKEKFINALEKAGLTSLGAVDMRHNILAYTCEFNVPGYLYSGEDYFMPVPYFDNLRHDIPLMVKWDKEKKEFNLKCYADPKDRKDPSLKGYMRLDMGVTRGYVMSNEMSECICAHCGISYNPRTARSACVAVDGAVFCCRTCAEAHSYVCAYRSDGAAVWVHRNSGAVRDAGETTRWYTNLNAALSFSSYSLVLGTVSEDKLVECVDALEAAGFNKRKLEELIPQYKIGITTVTDAWHIYHREPGHKNTLLRYSTLSQRKFVETLHKLGVINREGYYNYYITPGDRAKALEKREADAKAAAEAARRAAQTKTKALEEDAKAAASKIKMKKVDTFTVDWNYIITTADTTTPTTNW